MLITKDGFPNLSKNRPLKFLVYLSVLFIVSQVEAQIPNNDFEEWDTISGDLFPHELLNDWIILPEDTIDYGVIKDTVPYSGSFALRLKRFHGDYITVKCGFPLNYHPHVLHGWYHARRLYAYDSLTVTVMLYNDGIRVDSGFWMFTDYEVEPWTPFSASISTGSSTADSATISIYNVMHSAAAFEINLHVDRLYFDDDLAISAPTPIESLIIFPNPVVDNLIFNCSEHSFIATIFNSQGSPMLQQSLTNCNKATINVGSHAPGIYLLQVDADNRRWTSKFVKE